MEYPNRLSQKVFPSGAPKRISCTLRPTLLDRRPKIAADHAAEKAARLH